MATSLSYVTEQRDFLQSIVDTGRSPMLVLARDLRIVSANRAFYHDFGVLPKATEGVLLFDLGNGQWDVPALRRLLEDVLPRDNSFDDFEVAHDFPGLGHREMLLNARKLYRPRHSEDEDGRQTEMILLVIEDVTERRTAETRLREGVERLQQAYDALTIAYEREHRIAEALQRPLTLEIAEDTFPNLSIATLFEAASNEAEVGGDFFDAFSLPQNRVLLAVADASGKGLAAAARTMQAKDVLRAFSREYPHVPAAIASRLSDYIYDAKRFDKDADGVEAFVCLVLALLQPETGEVSVLAAGAEPPLILRANGECAVIDVSGMPLGVKPQQLYTTAGVKLAPGDTLLLLTDGITEARAPNTKARRQATFLGQEGLIRLVQQAQTGTATLRDMGLFILDGARAFAGGVLRDDACLLLAQRR